MKAYKDINKHHSVCCMCGKDALEFDNGLCINCFADTTGVELEDLKECFGMESLEEYF